MKQEVKMLLGLGVLTAFMLLGAIFFFSKPEQTKNNPPSFDPKLLIRSDSHQTATDSAKVKIVEFGDYQCPACGVAFPVTQKVLQDYSGKVNFIFRNFPLPQHKNALIAAEVAEAAGDQGKFWEMHDKLYETQNDWAESANALDIFMGFAQGLGLNVTKFKQDVVSNKFDEKIKTDQNDGNNLGVNATPTFFINGVKMENAGYNSFRSVIDYQLSGK